MIKKNCKDCKYFTNGFLSRNKEWIGIFYCTFYEEIFTNLYACPSYQKNGKEEE